MFLHKAMRYYRLWIYACNAVLFAAVIVILVYSALITADYRLGFVPFVKFYHPTFLYAYVAIVVQGGVIQAVGCYAALKLNERLLNLYWVLLFVLLVGDLITGVVWIFRYDKIYFAMLPLLKKQLESSYGSDPDFTTTWDRLQIEAKCCGISGPLDYNETAGFAGTATMLNVPATCCHPSQALPIQLTYNVALSTIGNANNGTGNSDEAPGKRQSLLPGDNGRYRLEQAEAASIDSRWRGIEIDERSYPIDTTPSEWTTNRKARDRGRTPRSTHRHRHWQNIPSKQVSKPSHPTGPPWGPNKQESVKKPEYNFTCLDAHLAPNMEANVAGCGPILLHWLSEVAEALFVLGFCVIAFSKICFLGLLRYEIKEMIQKIKILHCEEAEGARQSEFAELAAALGVVTGPATSNHVQHSSTAGNLATQDQGQLAQQNHAQQPSRDHTVNLVHQADNLSEGPTPVHLRLNHLNPNYDSLSENSSAALLLPNEVKPAPGNDSKGVVKESHEMKNLMKKAGRQTEI